MDLNGFVDWAKEKDSRLVKITIQGDVEIWVWDSALMCGQYADDVSEIDLEGEIEREERKTLEKLQKKYAA